MGNHTSGPDSGSPNGTADGNLTAGNGTADPGGGPMGVWDRLVDTVDSISHGLADLAAFALILVIGFLVGRALQWAYDRARQGRQLTSRQILIGKTFVLGGVTVALAVAVTNVYGADLLTLFTTLGILSVALGFGMQNTVANLAAGVGLSLDKPFDVGDRILVGQTWGDVESIGLRSTRIRTTSGQHVVIPNAVLDTQEVWNSTLGEQDHLRVEVPVGISYDSSVELAEDLMLQAARRLEHVLAYPEPVVRARRFGDNSVDLELRVWLTRAVYRPAVTDQLIRGIKAAFDAGGVHFPFPQRTISYLADMDEPAPTPEHLEGGAAKRPTILVCTHGVQSARRNAADIVEFVNRLEGRLVALHIRAPHESLMNEAADESINHYVMRAQRAGVPAAGRAEMGDVSAVVAKVAKEEGARLVVFGPTNHSPFGGRWVAREIQQATRACHAPVTVFDRTHLDDDYLEEWREVVHPVDPDVAEADEREARRRAEAEEAEAAKSTAVAEEPDAQDEGDDGDDVPDEGDGDRKGDGRDGRDGTDDDGMPSGPGSASPKKLGESRD